MDWVLAKTKASQESTPAAEKNEYLETIREPEPTAASPAPDAATAAGIAASRVVTKKLETTKFRQLAERVKAVFNQVNMAAKAPLDRALEKTISTSRNTISDFFNQLSSKRITTKDFADAMRNELKKLHFAAMVLGAGGVANLSANHYESLKEKLGEQFEYLDGMIQDFDEARGALGIKDQRRAESYAESARSTARQAMRQFLINQTGSEGSERRRTTPADHCDDCLAIEAMGWQEIGSLPQIGDSICGNRCHCFFEFRPGPAKNEEDISISEEGE